MYTSSVSSHWYAASSTSISLTDKVSVLHWCLPLLANWLYYHVGVSEILQVVDSTRWPRQLWVDWKYPLLWCSFSNSFSGYIFFIMQDWASVTGNTILGGQYPSAILRGYWLRYHPSHHDHSVTCHVPEIQGDTHIPYCSLLRRYNLFHSDCHHRNQIIWIG